ncbi:MAG: hypothetical protein HUK20_10155 [Fibrobacter sp.]|nr:hypothetical protein [Fibrobacter sp.]
MPNLNYDDIMDLPYPRNDWNFLIKHPRMSMENRAKIFSPFAALRGHSDAIEDTAGKKLVVRQDDLMEDSRQELDETLGVLARCLQRGEHPLVKVNYFVQDKTLAAGIGHYENLEGIAVKLDAHEKTIRITDKIIKIEDLKKISFPK